MKSLLFERNVVVNREKLQKLVAAINPAYGVSTAPGMIQIHSNSANDFTPQEQRLIADMVAAYTPELTADQQAEIDRATDRDAAMRATKGAAITTILNAIQTDLTAIAADRAALAAQQAEAAKITTLLGILFVKPILESVITVERRINDRQENINKNLLTLFKYLSHE
jgi:hypothetical protein